MQYIAVLFILWVAVGFSNAYSVLRRARPVLINTHLRKNSNDGVQKVPYSTFIITKSVELSAYGIYAGEAARNFIKGIQ